MESMRQLLPYAAPRVSNFPGSSNFLGSLARRGSLLAWRRMGVLFRFLGMEPLLDIVRLVPLQARIRAVGGLLETFPLMH